MPTPLQPCHTDHEKQKIIKTLPEVVGSQNALCVARPVTGKLSNLLPGSVRLLTGEWEMLVMGKLSTPVKPCTALCTLASLSHQWKGFARAPVELLESDTPLFAFSNSILLFIE